MKSHNSIIEYREVTVARIIIGAIILLLCTVSIFLVPNKIISDDFPHLLATSLAITEEDNLLFYDYKVYSSQERFELGLVNDVKELVTTFQGRNEILAVRVYGESVNIIVKDEYIFIEAPDVPNLNIEYYLAKNLKIADTSLPCRTFIMLINDVIKLINNIYLAVLAIFFISILAPVSIKIIRNAVLLRNNSHKDS